MESAPFSQWFWRSSLSGSSPGFQCHQAITVINHVNDSLCLMIMDGG
jgi:hypothetical protein